MLITELNMLFHHLFSVCGILKVPGENRKPICRHLHNYHLIRYVLIMDLPMHHWLSWVIKGQNLPEISVQLPAFSSLFLLWVPHITSSTLPYLTLRTTGFSLSQTTPRLFEVFDLLCWSVSAAPDVRCCVWH